MLVLRFRSPAHVKRRLSFARAIDRLTNEPETLSSMGRNALLAAASLTWVCKIERAINFYSLICKTETCSAEEFDVPGKRIEFSNLRKTRDDNIVKRSPLDHESELTYGREKRVRTARLYPVVKLDDDRVSL